MNTDYHAAIGPYDKTYKNLWNAGVMLP